MSHEEGEDELVLAAREMLAVGWIAEEVFVALAARSSDWGPPP